MTGRACDYKLQAHPALLNPMSLTALKGAFCGFREETPAFRGTGDHSAVTLWPFRDPHGGPASQHTARHVTRAGRAMASDS